MKLFFDNIGFIQDSNSYINKSDRFFFASTFRSRNTCGGNGYFRRKSQKHFFRRIFTNGSIVVQSFFLNSKPFLLCFIIIGDDSFIKNFGNSCQTNKMVSEQSTGTRFCKRSEERRVGKECSSRWSP